MCGRFTQMMTWPELVRLYRLNDKHDGRNTPPRYNIAPTQTVPFVHNDKEGNQVLEDGRWWLVPFWAKEMPKIALFNARSEDAEKKPSFRDAYKTKRCLIPADGFYEWTKAEDGGKDPWFIHLPDREPFSFAGLWAHNDALDVTSCTILTMAAGDPMQQLHDRQPIILDPTAYDEWLSAETSVADAKALLGRNLDNQLQFHRVSRDINSSKFNGDPGILANAV
ncbi:putative SOS response-associated peptidase YedK [Ensifer adhaerens]|uniref:SOS response-associated peptidase YedK n=1 Tax=Ensifer adhaerens TaxID=106592 RepID=A0ACC5SXE9_ENSAD|nr:SOS response-associated peptidase [Ensifer adhaerens]MBP1873562.1 putative SOS response-associated peptidase YedK [Ensifer adhaerens]